MWVKVKNTILESLKNIGALASFFIAFGYMIRFEKNETTQIILLVLIAFGAYGYFSNALKLMEIEKNRKN